MGAMRHVPTVSDGRRNIKCLRKKSDNLFASPRRQSRTQQAHDPSAGSRYLFTANTRRLLIEEGYRYHMDDYSDDKPFWDTQTKPGNPILILPYAIDTNDMKMWNAPAYTPRAWLEYLNDTLDFLQEEGASAPRMMSLGLHLRIIGRSGRMAILDQFLKRTQAIEGVWIATRAEIMECWTAQFPPPNQ